MSPQRTVLIVVENSYVPFDVRVLNESKAIQECGWRAIVICPFAPTSQTDPSGTPAACPEDLNGIAVYRFPLSFADSGVLSYLKEYMSAFVSIARLSWRVWRREHFDIIHFCNPPDIFFPIAWFYRLLGVRVVFDHHDLFPETISSRYQGWAGRLLFGAARLMEYLSFHAAHRVIATNQSFKQIALHRGRIPEARVQVVRNGPITGEFAPVEPVPDLKRGLPYMACYVGVMGHEDGIMELMAVIHHLVKECGRDDILFVLLGDGAARASAQAQVKAWGLENAVEMPGLVRDRRLVRQYLCTADVCLSPEPATTQNMQSTFIKIGEYMAMGKPVVAFDLKESRFTAQDAAVFAEPGNIPAFADAIAALLADPERRQHVGKFGRQRVLSELGWEHQKGFLLQAYNAILK